MSEDTLPGAAQEAPKTFRVLLAPLWPRLPLVIGYSGAARWLALYQGFSPLLGVCPKSETSFPPR